MKTMVKALLTAAILLSSALSQAADDKHQNLRLIISKTFPGAEITGFKASGVPDILEFNLGAQVLYISKDGRFLFQGDIFDLVRQENITEKAEQTTRVSSLNKLGEKNMLVYKAKGSKRHITVFTDIDCYYCRKLHEEIGQYSEKGIDVRYIFMPLKGKKSSEKSESVWCAKNPQEAMTNAKKGRRLKRATCENPLKQHMVLGNDFGIRGTPAIVFDTGKMIPGYRPVNDIEKMLNKK